ncbi:2Fe-2S iron-sulfur cluster-binding protein [Pigmentiphaga sp. D-2]|uniref:xanthine dehydrogenase family Fe-S subunit n=1 Tax=Pigmentiphaga sp. D-2 TaxID=1002116 RepID=UPI00104E5747|nr:2Fe-2S iron-sulfur cluster-binding protein [Pigmentiphaga sp. D-2]
MTEHPISLTVNGAATRAWVEPRTSLGDFLREDQHLTGLHLACEHGVCGACNVYVDGALSRSCTVLAVACEDLEVATIEAFDDDALMAALRQAFSRAHALQCGYCTPGMLMSARDIVARFPDADEATIRRELAGNLCRCTGYAGIVRAILDVVQSGAGHRLATPAPRPAHGTLAPCSAPARPAMPASRPEATPTAGPVTIDMDAPVDTAGMTRVSRRFDLAVPADRVWDFFSDLPRVSRCMPGMEVEHAEDYRLHGRMTVKAGPIRAVFDAQAHVTRDPAARRGTVHCRGIDRITRTQVACELGYALADAAPGATSVHIDAAFRLAGRLAEFSRADVVQALADQLTARFAANVAHQLTQGGAMPAGAPRDGGELRLPLALLARQFVSTLSARAWRALRRRPAHSPDAAHRLTQRPRNEDES